MKYVLGIVFLIIIGLAAIFILSVWVIYMIYNYYAIKAARRYCEENKLEYIKNQPSSRHYAFSFQKNGKIYYAKYTFERNRTITWINANPLELIKIKEQVKGKKMMAKR